MRGMRLPIIMLLFLMLSVSACKPEERAIQTDIPSILATETLTIVPTNTPTRTSPPNLTSTPTFTVAAPTLMDSATPKPLLKLCSPLAEQTLAEMAEIITDPYNPPPSGKDDRHHGTDFAYYRRKDRTTIAGEIVQAILPGKVAAVLNDRLPYGNMVLIETGQDDLSPELITALGLAPGEALYHLYAHFGQPPRVILGQQVACGEPLGEVGATGYNIVNPHLHLETRLGPAGADFSAGMAYYSTAASGIERTNYELWRTSGIFRHFDPMTLINLYLQSEIEK